MTFKTFKERLEVLEKLSAFEKGQPDTWISILLFAYYATDEGAVLKYIDDDFKKLNRSFKRKLPNLLQDAGRFHLVKKLDLGFCRDVGELN